MRRELMEYVAFRFEKVPEKSLYDEDGEYRPPTWDQAIRTELRDMSQNAIANEIRYMDRTTQSVIVKKSGLPLELQRHIDRAQEQLTVRDGNLVDFVWVLGQIDHQLRPVTPVVYPQGKYHTRQVCRSKPPSSRSRSKHGHSHHHKKKYYERISITAYFRREPRPHAPIRRLWELNKYPQLQQQQMFQPAQQSQQGAPPGNWPGPARAPPGHPPPGGPGGPPPPGGQPPRVQGGKPPVVGKQRQGGGKRDSGSDSDSSSDSGGSTDAGSSPNTSHYSASSAGYSSPGRKHKKGGMPARKRHENAQHFGVPRYHIKGEPRYIRDAGIPPLGMSAPPPLGPAPPPLPVAPAHETQRLAQNMYLKGRQDERFDAHEELAHSRPHIIQATRSVPMGARTVSMDPTDVRRRRMQLEDEISRLDHLSLSADDYDSDSRLEDPRVLRELEQRRHRGSIVSDDPWAADPWGPEPPSPTTFSRRDRRVVPEYARRPEAPRYVEPPSPNPFSPHLRRYPRPY
jgi:hypothetical protein